MLLEAPYKILAKTLAMELMTWLDANIRFIEIGTLGVKSPKIPYLACSLARAYASSRSVSVIMESHEWSASLSESALKAS